MKLDEEAPSAPRAAHVGEPLIDIGLTSSSLMSLEYFAPPPALAPFVTTFFLMRCDEPQIIDVQPAGIGLLVAFMRGRGEIRMRDGTVDPSHRINILTPLAAAAPIVVTGPWHNFGAALSPLGWAAITGGLSAATHGNRLLEAGELLGPEFTRLGSEMAAGYGADRFGPAELQALLADAIVSVLKPVPQAHVRLIATVAQWLGESLSPRVDRLQDLALYSPRQLQRLVDQYYGLPPKQLARKYRALRAAGLLSNPATTDEDAAAILNHFYDQSHLIREIRLFAGRTPARLTDSGNPLLSALLESRNFREIAPRGDV